LKASSPLLREFSKDDFGGVEVFVWNGCTSALGLGVYFGVSMVVSRGVL